MAAEGNPWIVDPAAPDATERIELEWIDGEMRRPFWIEIRRLLSIGQHRKMLKSVSRIEGKVSTVRGADPVSPTSTFEWTDYSFARMETYIVDWSLAHEARAKMPPTRSSFEKLRAEVFQVIDEALDAHEARMEEEKKVRAGSPTPSATSD